MRKKAFYIWLKFLLQHPVIYSLGLIGLFLADFGQILSIKALGVLVDLFSNKFPTWMTNQFDLQSDEKKFLFIFTVLLLVHLSVAFGRFLWRITLARQNHVAGAMLKNQIWESSILFPRAVLRDLFSKGTLMNISISDVRTAKFLYGMSMVGILDVGILGTLTIGAMFLINIKMTLMTIAVLGLLPYLIGKLATLEINRYDHAQTALSSFNELASDCVATIKLQRLSHSSLFWQKMLDANAENYRTVRLKAVFTSLFYMPITGLMSILSFVILFSVGIYLVIDNQMSVGDFVAMQGLIFVLQDPLMELGFTISDWRKGMTSLARIAEVISYPPDQALIRSTSEAFTSSTVFDVSDLSYSYPGKVVFSNLTFKVNPGDRLGIVGKIGSGKSTLVEILAGLKFDHSGVVKFYGSEFSKYDHQTLRKNIRHVPQKCFLFADSIRNNIALDGTYSDDEIWWALQMAGIDEDVRHFPDQLDTQLGEWGINVSGGQKQRLTLARALITKPKILLLDDCLSAVDTVTEEKILANLDVVLKGATIIWVAHRRSTLKYCDQILEL